MSPGPTFDRVYVALKEQLTSGRFAPGDPLEPAALSEELNASVTPVRDALHRLVGERMVETPRHDGFRVPQPTEAELRDLYGWNGRLLDLCLRHPRPSVVPAAVAVPDWGAAATAELFLKIARCSPSEEQTDAVALMNARLGAARIAEDRLFSDLAAERAELGHLLETVQLSLLRRRLATYHRRRQRHVPELLVIMRHTRGEP